MHISMPQRCEHVSCAELHIAAANARAYMTTRAMVVSSHSTSTERKAEREAQ
jgi:hypothetical protein